MKFFDRFENAVERGVNNVFSRVFRSGLKPVDISSAIHRAMDDSAMGMSGNRAIAPNVFVIKLSPSDLESLEETGLEVLADEFAKDATEYASNQSYALLGAVEINFVPGSEEITGTLEVHPSTKRGPAAPATGVTASPEHPILDIAGEKWLLTEEITVIGRSRAADIQVADPSVSRQHIEIRVTPAGVILTDLGSRNGTLVEGNKVSAATLVDGNQITIGQTNILFWSLPES